MSLPGVLSQYPLPADKDGDVSKRPFFTSGDLDADRAVVFIGGLYNGLMEPHYVVTLSNGLKEAKWKFIQFVWTSQYTGFGTGSLDRDVAEMSALIKHLRSEGLQTAVIMGHSTGSQDVIHYLTSPGSTSRAIANGGIMQAPASDRQYFQGKPEAPTYKFWADALVVADRLTKEGKKDQLMSEEFCKQAGCPMSAYRTHSLVGIGGDDDYFSSDIPDTDDPPTPHVHPLSKSFGTLQVPALALWSEKDEYGFVENQQTLLDRWTAASKGKLETRTVKGATHGVAEPDAQKELTEITVGWLKKHFGA